MIAVRPDVDAVAPLETPPGHTLSPGDDPEWYHYGDTRPEDADDDRLSYALFSGGDDSLSSTYYCMKKGLTDAVLYLKTNTGLAENVEYVKSVCREFGWPLLVYPSPMSLVEFAMKYGFPGSGFHSVAYGYFKERQLQRLASEFDGKPHYHTGVRKAESDRRAKNISDEEVVEVSGWYWHAPVRNWADHDVDDHRAENAPPRNPIAEKIHRSGDCYCGAFAHRDELIIDLRAAGYDRHAVWLEAVETAVQAYRGKLSLFRDEYPDVIAWVDAWRKAFSPKPMRLPVLRHFYPFETAWLDNLPIGVPIIRAREDAVNYWGHGEMANRELTALISEKAFSDMSLCQFCQTGVDDFF